MVGDDATGSPQTVALSGTGVNQQPQAVLTPASLAFSAIAGTTTASQTVVLSNPGTATLNISSIALTGANASAFNLSNGCGQTLAANAACNLTVTFSPAAASAYTAAISVTDNAPGSPQNAALTGTGTVAPTLLATLAPATIAFANQLNGTTSAAQTLTLTNTGNSSISITGVTLTGANPTAFGLTSSCGSTLAAGAQCSMAVTFKPSSAGSLSATVSVADNATGSPQTAALTGTGTAPPEFTTTSPTPPQTVTAGGAATYQISVTSTTGNFNLPVTLSAAGLPSGATVTFTPSVVTPGASGATSTMVVQTSAAQLAGLSLRRDQSMLELAVTAMLTWLFCMRRMPRLPRAGRLLMLLGALTLLSLGASGCGGGFPQPSGNNTYVITVTGTNGTDQHATSVTLTVQ
jgi:Abnormal spindle-like microcephaly-assoc'd, ASPM-SPD-2-Hydin